MKVSETRYATGQGMQADVLQAQVELGNYLDRLLQWRQQQDSLKAELNALRNRPAAGPRQSSGRLASPVVLLSNLTRCQQHARIQAPGEGLKDPD